MRLDPMQLTVESFPLASEEPISWAAGDTQVPCGNSTSPCLNSAKTCDPACIAVVGPVD